MFLVRACPLRIRTVAQANMLSVKGIAALLTRLCIVIFRNTTVNFTRRCKDNKLSFLFFAHLTFSYRTRHYQMCQFAFLRTVFVYSSRFSK